VELRLIMVSINPRYAYWRKTAKHKRSINVYRRLATDAVRDGDLADCTQDAVKIPRGMLLPFFPANTFWGGKSFIPILTLYNL